MCLKNKERKTVNHFSDEEKQKYTNNYFGYLASILVCTKNDKPVILICISKNAATAGHPGSF